MYGGLQTTIPCSYILPRHRHDKACVGSYYGPQIAEECIIDVIKTISVIITEQGVAAGSNTTLIL